MLSLDINPDVILLIVIIVAIFFVLLEKKENMEETKPKPLCGPGSDPMINCDSEGLPVCGPGSRSGAKCCGPSHRNQEPCPLGQCCSAGGVCGGTLGGSTKDEFCSNCDIKTIKDPFFGKKIGATVNNCRGGFRDTSYDGTSLNILGWEATQTKDEAEKDPKNLQKRLASANALKKLQDKVLENNKTLLQQNPTDAQLQAKVNESAVAAQAAQTAVNNALEEINKKQTNNA